MKKPDRFERQVRPLTSVARDGMGRMVGEQTVVNLLRKEHRWVERLIKQYRKNIFPASVGHEVGALLAELRQRRK